MKSPLFVFLISALLSSYAHAIRAWDAKITTLTKNEHGLLLRGTFTEQAPATFKPNTEMTYEEKINFVTRSVHYFLVEAPERKGGQFCGPSDNRNPNYRTIVEITKLEGSCPVDKGWISSKFYCQGLTFEAEVTCKD